MHTELKQYTVAELCDGFVYNGLNTCWEARRIHGYWMSGCLTKPLNGVFTSGRQRMHADEV